MPAPTQIRNLLGRPPEDYTAVVPRTTSSQAPAAIATALGDAEQVVVPTALPPEWTRELNARVVPDAGSLGPRELNGIDAVLTGCHTAIASTGTIVLGGDERRGRRARSLVPRS